MKALSSLFAEEDSMKIDMGVPPPGCFDFTECIYWFYL